MYFIESALKNGGDPAKNFLFSPILTPDHILSKFPPTTCLICEIDSLRDF